jgi:MFS family permease
MTLITPESSLPTSSSPVSPNAPDFAAGRAGPNWMQRLPFYYGWVNVVIASLAMTATLPGRTHGLGLITEPLLKDLQIERTLFANINLASSLLGAVFCLAVGYLIDRYGVRVMLTAVSIAFGLAVLGMAFVRGPVSLLLALVLIRGTGQSALSIVSMAIVGKWFSRRMGMAMGLYTVLMTIGFIASVLGVGSLVQHYGWRPVWYGCAYVLIGGLAPVGWMLVRNSPEVCQLPGNDVAVATRSGTSGLTTPGPDFTYQEALRTPAFWIFACGTSMFNLVWSAITLFNESILEERGFTPKDAILVMAILTGGGLVSNLICGAIARRHNLGYILGTGLLILAINLGLFPHITTRPQLQLYALAMGLTGGIVMVVFFAAWRLLFGASHLGRIQGPAQLLSTVFSAFGPLLIAQCHALTHSYRPGFYVMSAGVGMLAVAAILVPLPRQRSLDA